MWISTEEKVKEKTLEKTPLKINIEPENVPC